MPFVFPALVLDDGTIVTSSYGHFDPEDKTSIFSDELRTYICSKRINLEDTNALVAEMGQ